MSDVLPVLLGRGTAIRAKLTTTADTVVYTCPADHTARVVELRCTNIDTTTACDITVTIVNAALVAYTFYATQALAAKASIDFDFHGHPLKENETINVQASNANDIHVTGIVLEMAGAMATSRTGARF